MGTILARIAKLIGGLSFGIFSGWKGAIWAIGAGIATVVVFNTFYDITQIVMTFAVSKVGSSSTGMNAQVVQVTGLAAYLAGKLRIPECVSYILSMVILKWTLVKIPFVKW
jgi:hypothetical protein